MVSSSRREAPSDSLIEIVWRQRAVVAVAVFICVALAGVYLVCATRMYKSTSRLYVQPSGPRITGNEPVTNQREGDNFLFTQKEIVSSTPVLAMVLGTPGVRDLKTFDGVNNVFAFIRKNLDVQVGKKDELISVAFDGVSPEEANKIVGAVVDSYIDYQSKQRHSSASNVLTILQKEKQKLDTELAKKTEALQEFRKKHGMLSGADGKSDVTKQRLDSLSAALIAAQMETINAKSSWDEVKKTVLADPKRAELFEEFKTKGIVSASSIADETAKRTEMLQWQSHLQELKGQYLPNHPRVQRVEARINQLAVEYAGAVERRMESAVQKEKDLQASYDTQQQLAIAMATSLAEEARMQADVTRLTALVDAREGRIKEVAIADLGGAPKIEILEPAGADEKASSPAKGRTLAIGLLAGLFVGMGLACVRDWYDYRFRSAEEIKAALGVTVLGLIPQIDDESSPIARGQKIHVDPASEVAEAYRSLRTAVYFGAREHQARTILVTSPERGDGKTTVASNLAISMAHAGERVLLIDSDLRAPMQDLIFGINGRVGMANILSSKEPVEGAIRHTGIEGLDILPAGVAARNPAELLNSQKFTDLLESLAEKYDHVVVDSPPLLAVTDARIVAASCDATLLVLRAGKSNRKLSEMSLDGLVSVGAKVLGVAINDVRKRSYSQYGSYGRYGYGEDGQGPRGVLSSGDGSRRELVATEGSGRNGNGSV